MNDIYNFSSLTEWQDKAPPPASPAASDKPRSAIPSPGDRALNTNSPRSPEAAPAVYRPARHGTERRQTQHVSGRIPTALRIELDRIAKENNWSESYAVRVAIQEFIENSIEQSLGGRIEAIVTSAIDRNFKTRENREAKLLARIYKTLEEFRLYIDKVLALFFPGQISALHSLQAEAKKDARVNLSHAQEGGVWQS